MARNLLEIQDVALKIVVSGEGGVGRSMLAGTPARLPIADGQKVLAIGADPDTNLTSALGVSLALHAFVGTVAEEPKVSDEQRGAIVREFGQIFKLKSDLTGITEHHAQGAPAWSSLPGGGQQTSAFAASRWC